jgi:hypothetical protein
MGLLVWLLGVGGAAEGGGMGTILTAAGFVALGPLLYVLGRARAKNPPSA